MKTIRYRGFEILVGNDYAKAIPEEKKDVAYDCANQQDAENFVDQYRDEAGWASGCEFCGELGERVEWHTEDWKTKAPVTYLYYECKKPCCSQARDQAFNMGKAMAKGEI